MSSGALVPLFARSIPESDFTDVSRVTVLKELATALVIWKGAMRVVGIDVTLEIGLREMCATRTK